MSLLDQLLLVQLALPGTLSLDERLVVRDSPLFNHIAELSVL